MSVTGGLSTIKLDINTSSLVPAYISNAFLGVKFFILNFLFLLFFWKGYTR